jgi:hypothetical protein
MESVSVLRYGTNHVPEDLTGAGLSIEERKKRE